MDFPRRSLVHKNVNYIIELLQAANKGKQHLKRVLLQSNEEQIETLVEIVHNFLAGSEPFQLHSKEYIKRLRQHKGLIRTLARRTHSAKVKKGKLIKNQRGGALLASLLIPVVTSIVSALVSMK